MIDSEALLFGSGALLGVQYVGLCRVVPLFVTASGLLSACLYFFYLLNLLWLLLMSRYAFAIFLAEAISSEPAAWRGTSDARQSTVQLGWVVFGSEPGCFSSLAGLGGAVERPSHRGRGGGRELGCARSGG